MSEPTKSTPPYPSFHRGFEAMEEEHGYWVEGVEGTLPADLEGTLFRNGPGRIGVGAERFGHWFDGDGMVCAFTFKKGRVHFRNRYVRTPKYVRETELGRVAFRGFGTQRRGGVLANILRPLANPANTNVLYHGGTLLALYEAGHPFALDPGTLATRGEFNYGGALGPMSPFSAHGKVDPCTGQYINFGVGVVGIGMRGFRSGLYLYRVSPTGEMLKKTSIGLSALPFCHDFAITERYAVFFVNSVVAEGLGRVLLGRCSVADVLTYQPQRPIRILVVDLESLALVKEMEAEPGLVVHFGNAYERGNSLIVEAMYQDSFDINDALRDVASCERLGGGEYRRYVISLPAGSARTDRVCDTESEFPAWNRRLTGHKHRYGFTAAVVKNGADSFFNAIQKVDVETGHVALSILPKGCYGSEPMYVPTRRAGEDSGYLLDVVYDANRHLSALLILSAENMQEIARAPLKHHVPHQFHGLITDQVFV